MKRLFFLVALTIAAYVAVLTCVVSCANMGAGPDGGPYDETPPRIVGMTAPSQVASGAMTKGKKKHPSTKFQLLFSELVTIENATENVIVSPPQIEMPNIQAVGRRITVELLDSLKPETTYTVDFSDAIKDNNEGNPLGHFTYIFSTGAVTDTMEMSGHVLGADDLEPVAGILVGLHPVPETLTDDEALDFWRRDTLFTTTAFDRVARTDGDGFFSVKGVKDGRRYFAYALKDGDGDFAFSMRSERIAFQPRILKPSAFPDTRYDTLWVDSTRYDSIRVVPFTHYQPDDITLLAFQEANQPRQLLKTERTDLRNFKTWFTAPSQHVPVIRGLNFDARNAFVEQRSVGNDTITYWLRDSLLMQQDTLQFVYDYMAWDDSLQTHLLKADTLEMVSKTPWAKRLEQRKKEDEKWQKQLERRHKRGDFSQETPPVEHMKLNCSASGAMAPNNNVLLTFDYPLESFDEEGVHLKLMVDSIGTDADFVLEPVPDNILARRLRAEWRPEQKYQLTIDSAAVRTIYGQCNKPLKSEFGIEQLDKFGTFFMTLTNLPACKMMESVAADADTLTLDANAAEVANHSLDDANHSLSTVNDSLSLTGDSLAPTNDSLRLPTDSLALAADSLGLAADSFGLVTDSLGLVTDSLGRSVPKLERRVVGDAPVIVQLLDRSGKVAYNIEAVRLSETSVRAEFYYLKEGEYFMRCIVDADGDGKWSPGRWADRLSPEDVFYYNEKLNVRAGWDLNEDWDVAALPRHQQKPAELVKQKKNEKGKSSAHERNIKRLEDRKNGPQNNSGSNRSSMPMRF